MSENGSLREACPRRDGLRQYILLQQWLVLEVASARLTDAFFQLCNGLRRTSPHQCSAEQRFS
jgi:hypothetical protein